MGEFCLQVKSSTESPVLGKECFDVQGKETALPYTFFSDFQSALSLRQPNESLLIYSRTTSSGAQIVIDIYTVTDLGTPLTSNQLSQLPNLQLPFIWRNQSLGQTTLNGIPLQVKPGTTSNSPIAITLLTADDQAYTIPYYTEDQASGELIYGGSLVSAGYAQEIISNVYSWLKPKLEAYPISADFAYWNQAFLEAQEGAPLLPHVNQATVAGAPHQTKLKKVYSLLGIPEENQLTPLYYDPEKNDQFSAYGTYSRGYALQEEGSTSKRINHTKISVGNLYLQQNDHEQNLTLAHEIGHHRWAEMYELSTADIMYNEIALLFDREYATNPNLASFLFMVANKYFSGNAQNHDFISELYAITVATEYENRWGGDPPGWDWWKSHLDRDPQAKACIDSINNNWPKPLAALALADLILSVSTDPILSEKTRLNLCSYIKQNVNSDLWNRIQIIVQHHGMESNLLAAGATMTTCPFMSGSGGCGGY